MPQYGTGGTTQSSAKCSGQHLLPQPGTGLPTATLPTLPSGSPAWETEGTHQRTGQRQATERTDDTGMDEKRGEWGKRKCTDPQSPHREGEPQTLAPTLTPLELPKSFCNARSPTPRAPILRAPGACQAGAGGAPSTQGPHCLTLVRPLMT